MNKEVSTRKDILLVGPPGSGKTALALSFAERNKCAVVDLSAILKFIALNPDHELHNDVDWHIKWSSYEPIRMSPVFLVVKSNYKDFRTKLIRCALGKTIWYNYLLTCSI